jgi:hypothetical protein
VRRRSQASADLVSDVEGASNSRQSPWSLWSARATHSSRSMLHTRNSNLRRPWRWSSSDRNNNLSISQSRGRDVHFALSSAALAFAADSNLPISIRCSEGPSGHFPIETVVPTSTVNTLLRYSLPPPTVLSVGCSTLRHLGPASNSWVDVAVLPTLHRGHAHCETRPSTRFWDLLSFDVVPKIPQSRSFVKGPGGWGLNG